ncbi:MAG: TPM domain-containing protein [Lachnospiraceae bacterium]|nr:TPM domain-containing protein [Lachnospiraceae bacterium]
MPRLTDEADLLTDAEEEELLTKLDEISERQQCDVVVATVNSLCHI